MAMLDPGDIIDNRYVVERLLGRGGMAAVYLVRHRTLGSFFAVKVLEINLPSVRQRLIKEGSVQSRLKHASLVGVTDAIEVHGHAALVMEYVHGPNLAEVIERGRLPLDHVDAVVANVFDGLESAHRQGIVHRDLKPHNVMLSIGEKAVVAKIADFGLVKMLDEDAERGQTRAGMVFGTPEYMAPEQINDAKGVDARADLFSLGVMLYELVSGERPFYGATMMAILTRVGNNERKHLRELAPDAPERMINAVERALVVEPAERVQTVAELRELWFAGTTPATPAWDRAALLAMIPPLPVGDAGVEGVSALSKSVVSPTDRAAATSVLATPPSPDERAAAPVTYMAPAEEPAVATAVVPPPRRKALPVLLSAVLLLGLGTGLVVLVVGGLALRGVLVQPEPEPEPQVAAVAPAEPATPPRLEPSPPAPAEASRELVIEPQVPEPTERPVARVAPPKPRASAASGGAMPLGRWDGSFGGKLMQLALEGAPDALIGTSTVTFGANKIKTPVTGRYDATSRSLVLDDQLQAADAGRMTLTVAPDGKRAEGSWENFSNGAKVKVIATRRD